MFQETFVYENDESDRISFHCRCRKYYFRAINCHAPLTLITGKLRKKTTLIIFSISKDISLLSDVLMAMPISGKIPHGNIKSKEDFYDDFQMRILPPM